MIDTIELDREFCKCLYTAEEVAALSLKPGETPPGCLVVEGVMSNFGLHPDRLAALKPKVIDWLKQLPVQFHEKTGGGWSFLNACTLESGEQWGEHRNIEQLFVLGTGLKMVTCLMSRDMWKMLPGGMPYYMIVADFESK